MVVEWSEQTKIKNSPCNKNCKGSFLYEISFFYLLKYNVKIRITNEVKKPMSH